MDSPQRPRRHHRTGLAGEFDIRLEFPADPPNASSPAGPAAPDTGQSLIAALRQQLGLRLEPGRGTREYLIADRVERPSAN
jgi:uncharacterized protein (TIGR03435 family)